MSSTTSLVSTATSVSSAVETCFTAIPDKNGYVPSDACGANYSYYPSFAAAIIFTILFFATTTTHIYQAFRYHKLRLCWPLLVGTTWEFASFTLRSISTKHQQSVPIAFAAQILVLLAPMWVNAFIYMLMGRMIHFFHPSQRIFGIPAIQIAKIFVWLDVASFLTQVGGGMLIQPTGSPKTVMLGIHIYMGGIGFQELCIVLFTAIAVRFQLEMRRVAASHAILPARPDNWRRLLCVVYAVLALITVRIIFRMVEFASGLDPAKNPIPYHEAYFMALDALPMVIAVALLNLVHPGAVLVGEESEFPKGPSRKEKRAAKKAKKEEKRVLKEQKRMEKRSGKGRDDSMELGLV